LLIAYISTINKIGSLIPDIFNFIVRNRVTSSLLKKITGVAEKRSIPLIDRITLKKWLMKNLEAINPREPQGTLCLFVDEFTNFNDTPSGISAVRLLTSLGYKIITARHEESARTYLSKGLIRRARKIIRKNIRIFSGIIDEGIPLLGIEPSAILGFRDEYPELAGDDLREDASKIAQNCFMVDEFIAREFRAGRIKRESFAEANANILLHAHCQQKAISSSASTIEMLSIPLNYSVREVPSGCCGMAGSFGYEKEHFDLSNKIGELVLFPEVRAADDDVIIAAPGTSCRHHIKDGTGKIALHPVEILYQALKR
jgi:Fe-S oxidoreductase